MRRDIHAAFQIEAVGRESLHAGIQSQVFAALFFGMLDKPIEKRGAKSARTVGVMGDEIIDVESAAGEKEIEDAKTGHRPNDAIQFEEHELISLSLLFQDARGEIDGLDVGPQFAHDGRAAADLLGRVRKADSPQRRFRFRHGICSLAAH